MNLDEAAQHLEGCDLPPPADEARNMLLAELERLQAIEQRAREVGALGIPTDSPHFRASLSPAAAVFAARHILGEEA